MIVKLNFAILSLILGSFLLYSTNLTIWGIASVSITAYTFLVLLYEIGKSIAIRELMTFVVCLQMLFAPTLELTTNLNALSVTPDRYFSYTFPATLFFIIGLNFPSLKTKSHSELLSSVKPYLVGKEQTSVLLLVLGLIGSFLFNIVPIQIKQITHQLAVCLYASVMYTHYSKSRFKYLTLGIALGLLLYITVRDGMFGHMIFWVTLYVLIVIIRPDREIKFYKKGILVVICIFFILLSQSVKFEYRVKTWGDNKDNRKADPTLMLNLMGQRLQNIDFLTSPEYLGAVYHRLNQGGLLSETMAYVPRYEPFAGGELIAHIFYPLIPRIIWENKPMTGGNANILRFTPLIPNGISSSNISPFGEAYANFDTTWALLFLFFFGLLFNICFVSLLKIAESIPSVLLWLPCLFNGCISFETDVLSTWGSLCIMSTFVFLFWQISKRLKINL